MIISQLLETSKNLNENDLQRFLEINTEFIPTPFMLNHGLHFNVVLSKYPISTSFICDFAYITKSTVKWNVVFIEIESPQKKMFLNNSKDIRFSSHFNNAYDQVLSWKSYIMKNGNVVKESLRTLLRPIQMYNNVVEFKYVLVMGRNDELQNQHFIDMLNQKNSEDIIIMTYDSLDNYNAYNRYSKKHVLLTKEKEQYRIKNLDSLSTELFAYLNSSELIVTKEQAAILCNAEYEIDKWYNGENLVINNKYAKSSSDRIIKKMMGIVRDKNK